MSIILKTPEEIEKMRIAGRLGAEVLEMIAQYVIPGVTTEELDSRCHEFMLNQQKTIPAPLNYHGFPKSICTSVNHQVCHGIPSHKKLKKGDIVNIDVTVIKDEYHGDTSEMFAVGETSILAKRLIDCTQKALYLGISMVKPGIKLGDIGHAIQTFVERKRYSIVREYCGHGIGRVFHEEPQVLHYGKAGTGITLEEGMTFTIEPMVNAGKRHVKVLPDEWTVVTKDRSLSAQFEHTLAVTSTGFEIFTVRNNETIEPTYILPEHFQA
ncbi:MAG: type I methionyl aminopeptidase [Cycloclasticus sp. symbiont of Poecilosclerida sp. N]|nr:MAG: type I methionyl aminopeptidase [Cycloclasticus sp. symbiont of Poecilosclerida sp. N]